MGKMGKVVKTKICVTIVAVLLASAGCGKTPNGGNTVIDPYYLIGSNENREQLRDLFTLLAGQDNADYVNSIDSNEVNSNEVNSNEVDGNEVNSSGLNNSGADEKTFAIVREIANNLTRAKEYGKLIHFLGQRTVHYPNDPYNSYYLLMIANAYIQQDAPAVAALYFDLIIKNHPDLTVNGKSIHLACLNQLIELTDNPDQQVWYYQELLSRFPDSIDQGVTWFMLAQAHERIGNWNAALQAYQQFLRYTGTIVPGFPNAEYHARQLVHFNNSSKNWTYETLPGLLRAIKAAIDTDDPDQLKNLQAKVNFFAHSWGLGDNEYAATRGHFIDDSGMVDFNLSDFMRGNRISYANTLDSSSNATEAFLRTSGWSQYLSTWYFYFRKIYFPSDPEIHGRWEWAGIYYGEKF